MRTLLTCVIALLLTTRLQAAIVQHGTANLTGPGGEAGGVAEFTFTPMEWYFDPGGPGFIPGRLTVTLSASGLDPWDGCGLSVAGYGYSGYAALGRDPWEFQADADGGLSGVFDQALWDGSSLVLGLNGALGPLGGQRVELWSEVSGEPALSGYVVAHNPEPGSALLLLGAGMAGLTRRRRAA